MRRQPISLGTQQQIGIATFQQGVYHDADGDVILQIVRDSDQVTVVDQFIASHDGIGLYSYVLESSVTGTKGNYTVSWTWIMTGVNEAFTQYLIVVDPQPYWDSLNSDQKQLVDNVYHKVSDGFDSTIGGPYLWELPQSSFGLETIARLMTVDAMALINFSKPKAFIPPFQVGEFVANAFPVNWYGILERATHYELYKHLARSYLEQPIPENIGAIANLDRRQYSEQWMKMAEYEKAELDPMLLMLKRAYIFGVKTRASLLAGGIFPVSYLNPARPRWPYSLTRFY